MKHAFLFVYSELSTSIELPRFSRVLCASLCTDYIRCSWNASCQVPFRVFN